MSGAADILEFIELFHGTSSIHEESILEKGLLPRKYTGVSNYQLIEVWGGNDIYESHDDRVYFAESKERAGSLGEQAVQVYGGLLIVIKASLDTKNLVGDEDSQEEGWKGSLKKFGTCAYKGAVPKERLGIVERKSVVEEDF